LAKKWPFELLGSRVVDTQRVCVWEIEPGQNRVRVKDTRRKIKNPLPETSQRVGGGKIEKQCLSHRRRGFQTNLVSEVVCTGLNTRRQPAYFIMVLSKLCAIHWNPPVLDYTFCEYQTILIIWQYKKSVFSVQVF